MKNPLVLSVSLLVALSGGQLHAEEAGFDVRFGPGMQIALRLVDDYGTAAEVEEPEPSGASAVDAPASGAAQEAGSEPGLAGQMSAEEQRAELLEDAQATLNQIDEILLEANAEARSASDAAAGSGGGSGLEGLEGDDGDGREESAAGGEAGDDPGGFFGEPEPDTAEGRLPGNVATGKTGPVGSYEDDDDIVVRQVCDMAQREPDPEIKKNLEEKCESLKSP